MSYQLDPKAKSFYGLSPYAAMGNNPVTTVDPEGDFSFTAAALIAAPFTGGGSLALLPHAISADIGMWQGSSLANGTMNPLQWDYSSSETWGYMLGGAITGAVSGGVSNAISTSGAVGANTLSIAAGSTANSLGTAIYTGGQTDTSISFGFGSLNLTTGEFGYLGKNTPIQNVLNIESFRYEHFNIDNIYRVFRIKPLLAKIESVETAVFPKVGVDYPSILASSA